MEVTEERRTGTAALAVLAVALPMVAPVAATARMVQTPTAPVVKAREPRPVNLGRAAERCTPVVAERATPETERHNTVALAAVGTAIWKGRLEHWPLQEKQIPEVAAVEGIIIKPLHPVEAALVAAALW